MEALKVFNMRQDKYGEAAGQVSVGVIVGDGETSHVWRGSRSVLE